LPLTLVSTPLIGIIILLILGTEFSIEKFFPLIISLLLVEVLISFVFKIFIRGKHFLPTMLLAPGIIGLALLILYPLVFEFYLAFHDLKLTTMKTWVETGNLPFVGFKHFINVFTSSPLSEVSFWKLLLRTLWWTFINVFFHVTGGFALALLMNNKIKFRGIYRTLIVIPWAMPQVVAVLALRGEFHSQYGFINIMIQRLINLFPFLSSLGISPVQWLGEHPFLTCILINTWLGIPFMMVIILGGLQSISKNYYDAASIDGASWFQKFKYITLPLIKPVLGPAITLGTIWTFNNINVIYLVTGQSGGTEDADILVSALYKSAFSYYRYSYSAAFAIIIFIMLFIFSIFWLKFTKSAESVHG
jgi:arabinogalactan oligomer / maltooligosaccharide transport system permease protein